MKKLLCIVGAMNAGGAETFLMKIYRQIDKTKYQMDFAVNIDSKGYYDDEIISYGGKILRFPAKSESLWRYVAGLRKIVKEGHYDAVLRISSNAMGFLDLAVAKMAGAKVCVARSTNSSDGNKIGLRFAHWLGKCLFKHFVDVKIAPSSESAIYTFGKKDFKRGLVHILPNGLDLDYFSYSEDGRNSVRNEYGIASNQTVIGHVGRFSVQKNHSFLIDIFRRYHECSPESVLMLVGDGELKYELQEKVREIGLEKYVIFTGVRSNMPFIYSAMDVFVLPSLYEGMPNALIEAQACGLPCVSSNSVTLESNISGSVVYLSLRKTTQEWVDSLLKCVKSGRITSTSQLNKKGYDINFVINRFFSLF